MTPNPKSWMRSNGLAVTLLGATVLIGILAFSVLASKFRSYTMDDSYITFRYASNFSSGHGLVFNSGEHPRAEGITSPLYAVLLAPAALSGIDMLVYSKVLGLAASFLTALLSGWIIYKLTRLVTELPRHRGG